MVWLQLRIVIGYGSLFGMETFSQRTSWSRGLTELESARVARVRSGAPVWDLTCANPTRQGFTYGREALASFWGVAEAYAPCALGLPEARAAVAAYICGQGGQVDASQVWIGSGTSELYWHAMTILCDPGACWLVPQPGYPLFDYVADLAGVRLARYPLAWDGAWYLQADALEQAVGASGARALVIISPHNPTGHVWTAAEREMVVDCCRRHQMALVVDEVFLDYPVDASASEPSVAGCEEVLTICLSGASKVAAFPQGKVAWGAVAGPGAEEFLARAELVSDTYLHASTVIQAGLPALLKAAPAMQARIRARCRENLAYARRRLAGTAVSVCGVPAGWSMLLRVPDTMDDIGWALRALQAEGVLVHPGYLFGMESVHSSPFLGVSLLLEASAFAEGIERLARLVEEGANAQVLEGGT